MKNRYPKWTCKLCKQEKFGSRHKMLVLKHIRDKHIEEILGEEYEEYEILPPLKIKNKED